MNKGITRSMLLDSLVFGKRLDLYFPNSKSNMWFRMNQIRVTGLTLESGHSEGTSAQHYIVTCGCLVTYVNTID